jgi:Protein of unknown function (DUF3144)
VTLSSEADDQFYERALEHLRVASEQMGEVPRGQVSASLMYACARFNVWVSAANKRSPEELRKTYGRTIEYLVAQYRKMLVSNLDDYVDHFDAYAGREHDDDRARAAGQASWK